MATSPITKKQRLALRAVADILGDEPETATFWGARKGAARAGTRNTLGSLRRRGLISYVYEDGWMVTDAGRALLEAKDA